ncbi:4'-phosphopantetheinyl transferase superfamily protein [Lysinibacillus sp. FSL K6-0232]|uniref:4'-phosphopantetheinyl transferase family protein n=1 Tax=unclassified Lysinibacillus TaxID=2636778 RepID=UPI0030F520E7
MIAHPIQLFALPLGTPLTSAEWETLFRALPSDIQQKIMHYRLWQDRQRALLGHTLIKWALQPFIDESAFHIVQNTYGRPYIIDKLWQGDFNLSHSGDWIVLALAMEGRVGIDVEEIKPISQDVMQYALTEEEWQLIHHKPPHVFYELWTLKEALFKTGLFPVQSPHLLRTIDIQKTRKDLSTYLSYLDPQHPVTICWNNKAMTVNTTILHKYQLLQRAAP